MTYNTIKRESNLISPNEEKTTEQNKSTEIVFFFAKDQKDEGISLLYFICVIWFFIIKAMPITSFSVLFISFLFLFLRSVNSFWKLLHIFLALGVWCCIYSFIFPLLFLRNEIIIIFGCVIGNLEGPKMTKPTLFLILSHSRFAFYLWKSTYTFIIWIIACSTPFFQFNHLASFQHHSTNVSNHFKWISI